MQLDQNIITQLQGLFANLKHQYTLVVDNAGDAKSEELATMARDFASTSPQISAEVRPADVLRLSILRDGQATGISFRAIPGGHEFTSLILAVLNADGQGKNLPEEVFIRRIAALKTPLRLTTYASLSCTNCPEVVQALNVMALYNEGLEHEMVDGALFQDEVNARNISSVPAVYAGDTLVHIGKASLGDLLAALEEKIGAEPVSAEPIRRSYDLIVVGGGPSGIASAIYSARKGLHVAVVAERIGGQVNETTGIENIPSVSATTGTQLAADLRKHAEIYHIDLLDNRRVEAVTDGETKLVKTNLGEELSAAQVILATGASWRKLGVPGEAEYIGRGVAFCPHCDGPFFKDKDIAVIGGGNTAIDAVRTAIRLDAKQATIVYRRSEEEMPARAEEIKHAREEGTEFFNLHNPVEYLGDESGHVTAMRLERMELGAPDESGRRRPVATGEIITVPVDEVIICIGYSASTLVTKSMPELEVNKWGNIVVDEGKKTSMPDVYAGGDIVRGAATVILAMGDGRRAATAMHQKLSGRIEEGALV